MKKILAILLLTMSSITIAQAQNFTVTSMSVDSARVEAPFLAPFDGGIDLVPVSGVNLIGTYNSAITETIIGEAGLQTLYTAAANLSPYSYTAIPAGMIGGGPFPTGTVNMKTKIITVDMSSFFAAHGPMDQNLGGAATGVYHPKTGEYTITWSAVMTQGAPSMSSDVAFKTVTFIFSGVAQVQPAEPSVIENVLNVPVCRMENLPVTLPSPISHFPFTNRR